MPFSGLVKVPVQSSFPDASGLLHKKYMPPNNRTPSSPKPRKIMKPSAMTEKTDGSVLSNASRMDCMP